MSQNSPSSQPFNPLRWAILWSSLSLLGMLIVTTAHASSSTPPPDLSGLWKLDENLSDDPIEKITEARQRQEQGRASGGFSEGPTGGGGAVMVPIGGNRRRTQSQNPGSLSPAERQARLAELSQGTELLDIQHDDPTLKVLLTTGQRHEYTTDGKQTQTRKGPQPLKIKAKWEGQRLIITSKSKQRKVTEIYGLIADETLLQVLVRIEGGPTGYLELKRIYRPLNQASMPSRN